MTVLMEMICSLLTLTCPYSISRKWENEAKKAEKCRGKQKEIPSFTWKKRANPHERQEYTLKAEVIIIEEVQEHCTPFDIFRK